LPTGRLLDSQGSASVTKGDSLVSTGVELKCVSVDDEFLSTYGISLAAGRFFSRDIPTDDSLAFIINETAARKIRWTTNYDGIGKDFQYGGVKGKLIGIVTDFHFESLHQEITPMIFYARNGNNLSIKISGDNFRQGIAELEKKWKEFVPL